MSKKKVCIHCGAKPEHACVKCARKNEKGERENNICFSHAVFLDIAGQLETLGGLGLSKFKEHPSIILCSCAKEGEIEGCAISVINALKKELK